MPHTRSQTQSGHADRVKHLNVQVDFLKEELAQQRVVVNDLSQHVSKMGSKLSQCVVWIVRLVSWLITDLVVNLLS